MRALLGTGHLTLLLKRTLRIPDAAALAGHLTVLLKSLSLVGLLFITEFMFGSVAREFHDIESFMIFLPAILSLSAWDSFLPFDSRVKPPP